MSPQNDVIYDGFSFVDNGLVLTNIDHMTLPTRNNQVDTLANRDGANLTQSFLGTKPIYLEGYYDGDDAIDAQNMYDTLAAMLNRTERPLKIPHAGDYRVYTATPDNVVIKEPDGLNRLTFSFQFVVPSGNAVDQTTLTLFTQTITTASATVPFTVDGSVAARPLITITFTSVTGGTSKTVSIRNARDFTGLTFTRTFVSTDVITIDCDKYQIYINGVLTEPTGRIPKWSAGSGSLFYSDTFTSRSVTISGTYVPKRL